MHYSNKIYISLKVRIYFAYLLKIDDSLPRCEKSTAATGNTIDALIQDPEILVLDQLARILWS